MRFITCFILLSLAVHAVCGVQITEFCADTYLRGEKDEYFILEGDGTLDFFLVSDGEGSIRFPQNTRISGPLIVARYGSAFLDTHGYPPDFEMFDSSPEISDVIRSGEFRMGNEGDELRLLFSGDVIQEITWPGDVKAREGQVHFFSENTWDPRPLLLGQSRFNPAVFANVTVTAFVSPDSSLDMIKKAISKANDSVQVNVYEFTHPGIASLLKDAKRKGADVTVLLEGGPVGGIPPAEREIVGELAHSGIPVMQMTTTEYAHAKYRFNHAKYAIIDGKAVFITTENFKQAGFPAPGTRGNRGWGAYLEDEGLARYFTDVFSWDMAGGDIVPAIPASGEMEEVLDLEYRVEFPARQYQDATVTPVLSPDSSNLITNLIRSARSSIDIEQAYISNWTGNNPNPYLAAAIDASRRGVVVRILLDSYWFNVDDSEDNDEMADYINGISARENLPLYARCADLEANNLEKIHTKGVIIDKTRVLVSSINWNEHSPSFNREAGVIIDHPGVGEYFTDVFEDDWKASERGGTYDPDHMKIVMAAGVIFLLMFLYVRRRFS